MSNFKKCTTLLMVAVMLFSFTAHMFAFEIDYSINHEYTVSDINTFMQYSGKTLEQIEAEHTRQIYEFVDMLNERERMGGSGNIFQPFRREARTIRQSHRAASQSNFGMTFAPPGGSITYTPGAREIQTGSIGFSVGWFSFSVNVGGINTGNFGHITQFTQNVPANRAAIMYMEYVIDVFLYEIMFRPAAMPNVQWQSWGFTTSSISTPVRSFLVFR